MTNLKDVSMLLDDVETHALVVNALESSAAGLRTLEPRGGEDGRHFDRVAAKLDRIVSALHAPEGMDEPQVRLLKDLAERGVQETLRSALMMCGQAVVEVWETSIDEAVRAVCELTTSNVERMLELLDEAAAS